MFVLFSLFFLERWTTKFFFISTRYTHGWHIYATLRDAQCCLPTKRHFRTIKNNQQHTRPHQPNNYFTCCSRDSSMNVLTACMEQPINSLRQSCAPCLSSNIYTSSSKILHKKGRKVSLSWISGSVTTLPYHHTSTAYVYRPSTISTTIVSSRNLCNIQSFICSFSFWNCVYFKIC